MRSVRSGKSLLGVGIALLGLMGCGPTQQRDVVFQISTSDALLAGVYDGKTTLRTLRQHGDFGIGTFNGVDGEMVLLEGRFHQIRADGEVVEAGETAQTPFATVTHFGADTVIPLERRTTVAELEALIDRSLRSRNLFHAIRVGGEFEWIKARSVPKQAPPYIPLAEVVKSQRVFELSQVRGTLVGFRCPEFVKGVNVPGYHFHFLTADRSAGGHVVDGVVARGRIEIDWKPEYTFRLPESKEFFEADLKQERTAEYRMVWK